MINSYTYEIVLLNEQSTSASIAYAEYKKAIDSKEKDKRYFTFTKSLAPPMMVYIDDTFYRVQFIVYLPCESLEDEVAREFTINAAQGIIFLRKELTAEEAAQVKAKIKPIEAPTISVPSSKYIMSVES